MALRLDLESTSDESNGRSRSLKSSGAEVRLPGTRWCFSYSLAGKCSEALSSVAVLYPELDENA